MPAGPIRTLTEASDRPAHAAATLALTTLERAAEALVAAWHYWDMRGDVGLEVHADAYELTKTARATIGGLMRELDSRVLVYVPASAMWAHWLRILTPVSALVIVRTPTDDLALYQGIVTAKTLDRIETMPSGELAALLRRMAVWPGEPLPWIDTSRP